MACIYSITHIDSSKMYIGKTKGKIKQRWYHHKHSLNKGTHYNKYLQRAWNKYKSESFEWKIIKEGEFSHKELCELECKYIKEFKTSESKYGYNLTGGGEGHNPSHSTFFERTKSPAWELAQDIYVFWKDLNNGRGGKNHPGHKKISKAFDINRGVIDTLIAEFKKGWIPSKDNRWNRLYSAQNIKPTVIHNEESSSKKGKEYWSCKSKQWKTAIKGFQFWTTIKKPSIIKLKNHLNIKEGVAKAMATKFRQGWQPTHDKNYMKYYGPGI